MGNTGAEHQHVHYQLKDRFRNTLNPFDYWDQQGPIDPAPALTAHLADHQRYLGILASTAYDRSAARASERPQTVDPADVAAEARNKVRVLRRLDPGKANPGEYDANAPATIPNQIPSPDRSPTFAERFGSWASSPSVTAPLSPYQPIAPPPQADKPPGIVIGQPMPAVPLPPWVFGLPDP